MKKLLIAAGVAATSLLPLAAQARVHVGVGVNLGFPGYYQPYYAPPPPVYYAPPPVYYYGPPPAYGGYYYERPSRDHYHGDYRDHDRPRCYWDHGYRYCD